MRTKMKKPPDLRKYLKEGGRRIVTYDEGARMYSMPRKDFVTLAKAEKANFLVKRWALVNLEMLDEYIENHKEVNDESKT